MATETRHITRIYNTEANLLANLDNHQIAITTDDIDEGYRALCYKNNTGDLIFCAAIDGNATFNNVTLNDLTVNGTFGLGLTETGVCYGAADGSIAQDSTFLFDQANNKLTIGTPTFDQALTVSGNIRMTEGATRVLDVEDASDGNGTSLNVSAGSASGASNGDGGDLNLIAGNEDGEGVPGEIIGYTNGGVDFQTNVSGDTYVQGLQVDTTDKIAFNNDENKFIRWNGTNVEIGTNSGDIELSGGIQLDSGATNVNNIDTTIDGSSTDNDLATALAVKNYADSVAGVTDHGALAGLVPDDDHTQYLLADGTRALTGDWTVNASMTGIVGATAQTFTATTEVVTPKLTRDSADLEITTTTSGTVALKPVGGTVSITPPGGNDAVLWFYGTNLQDSGYLKWSEFAGAKHEMGYDAVNDRFVFLGTTTLTSPVFWHADAGGLSYKESTSNPMLTLNSSDNTATACLISLVADRPSDGDTSCRITFNNSGITDIAEIRSVRDSDDQTGELEFYCTGTRGLYLDENASVISPTEIKIVKDSSPTFTLDASNATSSAGVLYFDSDRASENNTVGSIQFWNQGAAEGSAIYALRGGNDDQGKLQFLTSDQQRILIDDDGTVFLGTSSTALYSEMLSVQTSVGSGVAASFFNDGNNTDRLGILIRCGEDDQTSSVNYYLVAQDGNGTDEGYLRVNNGTFEIGQGSDISFKDEVADAPPIIDRLNQVRVVNYKKKPHTPIVGEDNRMVHTGIIANELAQIFPDAADNDTPTGKYLFSPLAMVPHLIKAVQELKAEIDALKKP